MNQKPANVTSSPAWWGIIPAGLLLIFADAHLPVMAGWALNTLAILSGAYVITARKRVWYAWAAFWGLAAICALEGILNLFTSVLSSPVSAATQVCAWVFLLIWYCLLRIPRRQPPAPPQVSHVVHHHVIHGSVPRPGKAAGQFITDLMPDSVPGTVEGTSTRPAITRAPARPDPLARFLRSAQARVRR